jgi:hypothetical protein
MVAKHSQHGFHAARVPGRLRLLGLAVCVLASFCGVLRADEASDREYKVKAAFVYNFLKFVEGGRFTPAQEAKTGQPDPNDPIVVGVLGVPPSRIAFQELKDKKVGNRPVQIRWFKGFAELAGEDGTAPQLHPDLDGIRKCHTLFICPSEKSFLPQILPSLRDNGILTVGDIPQFLEAGGLINLLIEDKKVRFEVNLAAAVRAHLVIRSSLLRLAVRTVEHDRLEVREDQEKPGGSSHP